MKFQTLDGEYDTDLVVIDNWPFSTFHPTEDEAAHDILGVIEEEFGAIQDDIQELEDQRFIETATGKELEKLGLEVGVPKESGESESHYRMRIQIAKSVTRSKGTIEDFAEMLHAVFGDEVTRIDIEAPDGAPSIRVTIPQDMLDSIPLTQSELQTELNDALPVSDVLEIVSGDSFIFGESGSRGLGNGGLA